MSDRFPSIGIVGAGTMGAGIAQVAILSGLQALLYDAVGAALAKGQSRIAQSLSRAVGRGLIQADDAEAALRRLSAISQLAEVRDASFVIEAAPEDLPLKQRLFTELDGLADPAAILATNTSSLSVTAIAGATRRPERVIGMHFFNPVPMMKLVEIVVSQRTDPAVVEKTTELARRLGKTPVRAKDTPGFIVNRIARHFSLEALRILGEGKIAHDHIDRVMKRAGRFRMGPFELMDLIGIDVNFAVSRSVFEAFFHDPRFRPDPIQQRMVESGLLGRKTGRGFYEYPEGQKA
jgi:3-hydroxybutyryl-CoA dehydrogenase